MEFKKYNLLENSYQDNFINAIIEQGFGNVEYVVQEKVHGANLSFITDGKKLFRQSELNLFQATNNFSILTLFKKNILTKFLNFPKKQPKSLWLHNLASQQLYPNIIIHQYIVFNSAFPANTLKVKSILP